MVFSKRLSHVEVNPVRDQIDQSAFQLSKPGQRSLFSTFRAIPCRAFTLVELLVVIAIIGILVGLLLPAVQAAREAARRAACGNNIRQLALACLNYESARQTYPPGAQSYPSGDYALGVGPSWRVHILPYIEEDAAYDQLEFSQGGFDSDAGPARSSNENNLVFRELFPEAFYCPSSDMPKGVPQPRTDAANIQAASDYAGVAGASGQDSERRYLAGGGNVHAYNGILCAHCATSTAKITDGTTHVLLLAEQSDWGLSFASGQATPVQCDCRSSGLHGAWLGTILQSRGVGGANVAENRVFNTTTIKTNLGTKFCDFPQTSDGYCNGGACTNFDNGTPVQSAHPGGAHVAMADGSVQFLTEEIELPMFQLMAIRDDGLLQPIQQSR